MVQLEILVIIISQLGKPKDFFPVGLYKNPSKIYLTEILIFLTLVNKRVDFYSKLSVTYGDFNAKTTNWYKGDTKYCDGLKTDTITS